MGRPTRKFQNKAKTIDRQVQLRQRFIEAGKVALKESPDGEPSLRKIAQMEGYSPSALYRYFSSKTELMYAIREDYLIRSVKYAQQHIAEVEGASVRLRHGFEALIAFWIQNPDDFRHVYSYRSTQQAVSPVNSLIRDTSTIQTARDFCVNLVLEFFLQENIDPEDELINQLTDSIVVATHGVVSIPLGSPSINYCQNEVMVRIVIQAFISSWTDFINFIKVNGLTRRPTAQQFQDYISTQV